VIDEIEDLLRRYPEAKTLYTLDDLFVGNAARFDAIFDEWMRRGWDKRLTILGFFRSPSMTENLARKMKRMGWESARFGAESGSNRILKLMNKRATVEDHQRAIDICNSVGLTVKASFIRGYPGETEEDKQATIDFIERNNGRMEVAGDYTFRPFPGTLHYNGEDLTEIDMPTRAAAAGFR